MTTDEMIICLMTAAFVCVVSVILGVEIGRNDAISEGVAHYTVDPQTGKTELVYGCPTTEDGTE